VKGTRVPFMFYRKYPMVKEAIRQRNTIYNQEIELIEKLESDGVITVIRPEKPIEVERMERDIEKLTALYEEGYNLASKIEFKTR
jgi:predicted patatin/cPLA2 family phospholipase